MDGPGDTIVAPITGPFRAPVALIRVSGPDSWDIARKVFSFRLSVFSESEPKTEYRKPRTLEPRHAYYGAIIADNEEIDEGFLILFEEGRSYTGEASFELSCHGSPAIVRQIVSAMVGLGARPARPGEFTERAFMNGRIDLTQAEAVRETVEAATQAQQRRARLLRQGRLAQQVGALEERIARELARAEATVDFSEEIGELDRESARDAILTLVADIERTLSGYRGARLLREGLRVAIVGRPNVGKSSLLNALLGADRAIVTETPGTTRDTIEETVSMAGYPVVLTDTAGLRESTEQVERLGVERSMTAVETADEVWMLFEDPAGWTPEDEAVVASLGRESTLLVANKRDLPSQRKRVERPGALRVSALTGEGLEQLEDHIRSVFECGGAEIPLINERHKEDLEETADYLRHAAETLGTDLPTDLACVDLHGALQTVGRITGRTADEDILERIFREFCIGK
ncbi:MAG: tRNA uridine-5-carboxymethylaminomethyl(34) synthesis GTPase MnmE [Armatimonadetes bacterium]|nr:tRNA uridine-5-carboxymethylaminomethyl(34) synthesis GTPase MnmE [Armatimonadota bacterium]